MAAFFDLVFDIPADQTFTYRCDEKGEAAVGKRAMAPFGRRGRDSLGYIIGEREGPPQGVEESAIKTIRRVVDTEPVFDDGNITIARWLAAYYLCGTGQAMAAMVPSGRRMVYPALPSGDEDSSPVPEISSQQQAALDAIVDPEPMDRQDNLPQMFYLYGITGSGKTEVFLRAAEAMIEENKSVIYLVPEISLTHQTEGK